MAQCDGRSGAPSTRRRPRSRRGCAGCFRSATPPIRQAPPPRVLNLVVVVDRERRGEIDKRLAQVGRYHPSRTIICVVEQDRTTLDARATLTGMLGQPPGALGLCHERVAIEMGPQHLAHLDVIVDPILISDLATVVWSPHGHPGGRRFAAAARQRDPARLRRGTRHRCLRSPA